MKNFEIEYYCINLKKRVDRWGLFLDSAKNAGFHENEIMRFDAIESIFGALGCAKSHASILFDFMINSKSDYLCVFEDDFEFISTKADFIHRLSNLNEKADWDVLLLTGTSVTTFNGNNFAKTKRLFDAHSTAGYIIKSTYVPALLQVFQQSIVHMKNFEMQKNAHPLLMSLCAIDVAWKKLMREDGWHICNPLVGIQRNGFSDILGRNVDYSNLHKNKI